MSSSLAQTTKDDVFTVKFMSTLLLVALIYITLSIYSINYRLIEQTLTGKYPLMYKTSLFVSLLQGLFTAFTPFHIVLLLGTALLVGANIAMLIKTIRKLKRQGHITLTVGGATLLGIAVGGCGTCGISILAMLGLSTALSALPFHGLELHILAIVLLSLSMFHLTKKYHETVICSIPPKKKQK